MMNMTMNIYDLTFFYVNAYDIALYLHIFAYVCCVLNNLQFVIY